MLDKTSIQFIVSHETTNISLGKWRDAIMAEALVANTDLVPVFLDWLRRIPENIRVQVLEAILDEHRAYFTLNNL